MRTINMLNPFTGEIGKYENCKDITVYNTRAGKFVNFIYPCGDVSMPLSFVTSGLTFDEMYS